MGTKSESEITLIEVVKRYRDRKPGALGHYHFETEIVVHRRDVEPEIMGWNEPHPADVVALLATAAKGWRAKYGSPSPWRVSSGGDTARPRALTMTIATVNPDATFALHGHRSAR